MLSEHANVLSSPHCTCYVNKPATTQHGLDGIGLHWDACRGKKTRERMDVGEECKWGGEKRKKMAGHVSNAQRNRKRRAGVQREDETGRVVLVAIILAPLGTFG